MDLDADGIIDTRTRFAYDGNQIVMQFDRATAPTGDPADPLTLENLSHRYLWNPAAVDQLMADEHVTTPDSPGTILWPLADHLGTIRDLAAYDPATATTTVVNRRSFDAYGNLQSHIATTSAHDTLFAFTGRPLDQTTGLQNNLHRWYDPATGRWMSEDPIGFEGRDGNLYAYVGNGPGNAVDPSGLDPSFLQRAAKKAEQIKDALNAVLAIPTNLVNEGIVAAINAVINDEIATAIRSGAVPNLGKLDIVIPIGTIFGMPAATDITLQPTVAFVGGDVYWVTWTLECSFVKDPSLDLERLLAKIAETPEDVVNLLEKVARGVADKIQHPFAQPGQQTPITIKGKMSVKLFAGEQELAELSYTSNTSFGRTLVTGPDWRATLPHVALAEIPVLKHLLALPELRLDRLDVKKWGRDLKLKIEAPLRLAYTIDIDYKGIYTYTP